MPIPLLLAAAPAIASSVFGAVKGIQSLNQAKKIKPEYYEYGDPRLVGKESTYARQMLGQAQMQLNARNPFAAAQQRGILGSQANAMAGAQRAVTDPSQALAMTAALQANTDQAMFGQAAQEQQAYQQRMGNLMGAQQVMISEGDKLYQDRMRKFNMDQERKDALQQAGTQSLINAGNSLSSSLLGRFGKMFGGGAASQSLFSNPGVQSMVLDNAKANFNASLQNRPTINTNIPAPPRPRG
jgi:hypothetical protein